MSQGQIQLGKNGITDNFISTLKTHFNKHQTVKVSVLKSSGRDKDKMKEMRDEILDKLGVKYTGKIIGFTISLKKWRQAKR